MDISTIGSSVPVLRSAKTVATEKTDTTASHNSSSSQAKASPKASPAEAQEVTAHSPTTTQSRSAKGGAASLSPAQAILKRLSEQIAELREKVAEAKAELSQAITRASGQPSAEVDALRNQLEGLQNQLTALTGAYNDAISELNKSNEAKTAGSLVDISQ